jgi:hypothetical protein
MNPFILSPEYFTFVRMTLCMHLIEFTHVDVSEPFSSVFQLVDGLHILIAEDKFKYT